MSSKTFFIADQHYGHTNILKYCNRPFSTIEEMDRELILRHNSVVGFFDTVFHLGDFSFYKPEKSRDILNKLNGKTHILIKGNHDRSMNIMKESVGFDEVYDKFIYEDWMLQHHPIKTNKKLLCGHVHQRWHRIDDIINVGVDVNEFTPRTLDELTLASKDPAEYACKYCNKILHRLNKNESHWEGLCSK